MAIEANFVPGLLLYGLLCTNSGKYEEAEDILEAATSIEPDHIVAQTVFGELIEVRKNVLVGSSVAPWS